MIGNKHNLIYSLDEYIGLNKDDTIDDVLEIFELTPESFNFLHDSLAIVATWYDFKYKFKKTENGIWISMNRFHSHTFAGREHQGFNPLALEEYGRLKKKKAEMIKELRKKFTVSKSRIWKGLSRINIDLELTNLD